MNTLITILSNRRGYATIVSGLVTVAALFNIPGLTGIDQAALSDSLATIGMAIGSIISASLTLYSLFKPKK